MGYSNLVRCRNCGLVDEDTAFKLGRGRSFGDHPEHLYHAACGYDVTWHRGSTQRLTLAEAAALAECTGRSVA